MNLDGESTTSDASGPEGPANSGAGQGTPGQHDGGTEGPADSGAGGAPGHQDGGIDSGADSGAN